MDTSVATNAYQLHCFVCRQPFVFSAGDTAVILRHVAYGYDFAHEDRCLMSALALIFPEPGYDCAAFGRDRARRRVLAISEASGWGAVVPNSAEQMAAGEPVHLEPLRCWAVVEHGDGSQTTEGVVWDEEWLAEPGGAEFPEARRGWRALLGYVSLADHVDASRLAEWAALIQARRLNTAAGALRSYPAAA